MGLKMTASGRKELFEALRPVYRAANWIDKGLLLDGFVAGTGYNRKHAIALLNGESKAPVKRTRQPKYGIAVVETLIVLWKAANRICSQRLVPFIPTLIESLERFGHLNLDLETKSLLCSLSPATMDRLLKSERKKYGKRKSTTRPGHLLKRQIAVRTYSDWNEARPGFLEIDLVAHGGETASGQFLNTLTITDIASTWTECFGLISKSEAAVVEALTTAQGQLPFQILGIDSDNGSEFINHGLLDWCKKNQVTFTRSREYKKNDQAHVEERNGSVVRRLIGYDRYEGEASWSSLQAIYERSRLYTNFFQPSMKLASKNREGGKISRTYGTAYSPYERLLQNANVTDATKEMLTEQFKALDPVLLLKHIEVLQERFWNSAINLSKQFKAQPATTQQQLTAACEVTVAPTESATPILKRPRRRPRSEKPIVCVYPGEKKGPKSDLDLVWPQVCSMLETQPTLSAHDVITYLSKQYPGRFKPTQFGTIRNRILRWRDQHGFKFDFQKQKPGRKSNIDFIWSQALKELEYQPDLSRRKLHALMTKKLPGQVKPSQMSALAGRLKTWREAKEKLLQGSSCLSITLIESEEPLPAVSDLRTQ